MELHELFMHIHARIYENSGFVGIHLLSGCHFFFCRWDLKEKKWKTTLEWCHCVPPPKGNRQCQNSFFVSPLVNWTSFVIDLSSQQGRKRAVKRKQMLFENLFLKRSSLLLSFMSTCPGWVKWAEDILLVEVATKFLKTSLFKKKIIIMTRIHVMICVIHPPDLEVSTHVQPNMEMYIYICFVINYSSEKESTYISGYLMSYYNFQEHTYVQVC